MKQKTIKAVLAKKFKAWVESIESQEVRELAEQNSIITGGCIASMLLKEPVNDFDIYFRTQETAYAVAEYYIKQVPALNAVLKASTDDGRVEIVIPSKGISSDPVDDDPEADDDEKNDIPEAEEVKDKASSSKKFGVKFISSNAITLTDKIQLIVRFTGDPATIHENYDFLHCTNYWCSWDKRLVLNVNALASLMARELQYVGSKYPLCSIIRSRKFIKRGWTINAGQYLKMALQLNKLDLTNITVLRDQLVGVDAAYFMQVIHHCEAHMKENNHTAVDENYLVYVIDKIF